VHSGNENDDARIGSQFRSAAKRAFTLLSASRTHAKDYRSNPPTSRIILLLSALDRVFSKVLIDLKTLEATTCDSRISMTHRTTKPSASRRCRDVCTIRGIAMFRRACARSSMWFASSTRPCNQP